ncbi:hypothetical protein HDU98_006357 [Podochytrium sp. JEL0797]|nr:hypothetical protein HDU98_006357 [Podochytrium sp. JEL0797]
MHQTNPLSPTAWHTHLTRHIPNHAAFATTRDLHSPAYLAAHRNKVSDLVVRVKEVKLADSIGGDALVVFVDPVGEVRGNVCGGVFGEEGGIEVGSLVHLKNPLLQHGLYVFSHVEIL